MTCTCSAPFHAGAAAAFGALLGALLVRVTGRSGSFHAHPAPTLVALWAGPLVLVLMAGALAARRTGFAALLVAPWLVIGVLATALAAVSPGASIVLVLPLAAGTLAVSAAAALLRADDVPVAAIGAAVIGALGAGFTMIPLAILLHAAFLLELPFAISTAIGLAALPLLPLLATARASARVRNGFIAATAVLAVGGAAAALALPGYSELRPQPLNMVWAEDTEIGAAAWLVQTPGGEPALPPELRRQRGSSSPRRGFRRCSPDPPRQPRHSTCLAHMWT
jgi:hypothetical protein